MKIMVAADDRDMVDLLSYWLKGHGYDVIRAFDGAQVVQRWRQSLPDLVILDIQLLSRTGWPQCQQLRSQTNARVLILTAQDGENDESNTFAGWTDDCVRKPFSLPRLLARIEAVLRRAGDRAGKASAPIITAGPVSLDVERREVTREGVKSRLTPIESRLLHLLLTHTGQVLPTAMIVARVWGDDEMGNSQLVKTHIRHLRQKIEPNANRPTYITTVSRDGYTFSSAPLTDVAETRIGQHR